MTVPTLTSSPVPPVSAPIQGNAAADTAGDGFSSALSSSQQALQKQPLGKLDATQGKKTGSSISDDVPSDTLAADATTLPALALSIAVQVSGLMGVQTSQSESEPSLSHPTALPSADLPALTAAANALPSSNAALAVLPGESLALPNIGMKDIPEQEPSLATQSTAVAPGRKVTTEEFPPLIPRQGNPLDAQSAIVSSPHVSSRATPLVHISDTQASISPGQPTLDDSMTTGLGTAQTPGTASLAPSAGTSLEALPPMATVNSPPSALSVPNNVLSAAIAVPLQHPQWPQAFSQQITQMVQSSDGNTTQIAELRLDPPNLGPLRIAIHLSDNVAHAVFISAHAPVRQALEQALPQLQDQLAQAGISLGQTSVSDQQSQQAAFSQQSEGKHFTLFSSEHDDATHDGLPQPVTQRVVAANALIDTFA